ncbi:MAG TPA: hypothetical protein VGM90_06300 [Kofleriaceae bacterium]
MAALERLLQQLENSSEVAWNEETYDLADCSCLTDDEKAAFADKLLVAAHTGDARALLTLGYIGAPGASGTELFDLAKSKDPLAPVARRAMVQLGQGQSFVEEIADDAQHSPSTMLRIAAVMMLAKLEGSAAKMALLATLSDASDTVRSTAWDGIIAHYKLKPLISDPQGVRQLQTYIEIWGGYLLCDAKSFIDLGADEMRWVVRYLDAGTPPATLSIAWHAEQAEDVLTAFRECLFDDAKPLPVEEINALTGFERRSLETLVAYRLEKFDPRAAPALAALSAVWTFPILAELSKAPACPPDVSAAMNAACDVLLPLLTTRSLYSQQTESSRLEPFEQALRTSLGSPILVEYGAEVGNPRDGFWRDATITAYRPPGHLAGPPLRIALTVQQDLYFTDKPASQLSSIHVQGPADDPAITALVDALTKVGCRISG